MYDVQNFFSDHFPTKHSLMTFFFSSQKQLLLGSIKEENCENQ